jgi:hypothetical protein
LYGGILQHNLQEDASMKEVGRSNIGRDSAPDSGRHKRGLVRNTQADGIQGALTKIERIGFLQQELAALHDRVETSSNTGRRWQRLSRLPLPPNEHGTPEHSGKSHALSLLCWRWAPAPVPREASFLVRSRSRLQTRQEALPTRGFGH